MEELKTSKKAKAIDGGFFERFRSIRRSKKTENILESDDAIQASNSKDNFVPESGTCTLHDANSESEEKQSKEEELLKECRSEDAENLYKDILFQIMHKIGCKTENEMDQSVLFDYIQDVYKLTNLEHDDLLSAACTKRLPAMRLNVEVISAKELQPKDSNVLSDPFVTLSVRSAPDFRLNTTIKNKTLNPTWHEHFTLPLTNGIDDDSLVVEVWDFDPAEAFGEKMTKANEIKGMIGLQRLVEGIAKGAVTGKENIVLLGKCIIPLWTISSTGLKMWFGLNKKKKNQHQHQGLINVGLSFGADKNRDMAVKEHSHLLRILLLYELEMSKVITFWWCGRFSEPGESVIAQHSVHSGINANIQALAHWSAYASIHENHALSFKLFENLLRKLPRFLDSPDCNVDNRLLFWDGVLKLLPSCFTFVRNIREKKTSDNNRIQMLIAVLNIISSIERCSLPEDIELFPISVYGWLYKGKENTKFDIHDVVEEAVRFGAQNYISQINQIGFNDGNDEVNLQNVRTVMEDLRNDLLRSGQFYDKHFKDLVNINFSSICYICYENELSESVQLAIKRACEKLKPIPLHDAAGVTMAETLFTVYMDVKSFAALSPKNTTLRINEYHNWFEGYMTYWLDVVHHKALNQIKSATGLDNFTAENDELRLSSSPGDVTLIFSRIKVTWNQIEWSNVQQNLAFLERIIDKICRCCIYYADEITSRLNDIGKDSKLNGDTFIVTKRCCQAINNIEYIRQNLKPTIKGFDEILFICSDTLKNIPENTVATIDIKIIELIRIIEQEMFQTVRKLLIESVKTLHEDSNSMDRVLQYLDESLKILNTELNPINFERILSAIWQELAKNISDLARKSLDKRRPPKFFENLHRNLCVMIESFKCEDIVDSSSLTRETLAETKSLLELHGCGTGDLIHQYYCRRLEESIETNLGTLTVRCALSNDNLIINILNGRYLVAFGKRSINPYVRIRFSPEEKFALETKYRTNHHSGTLFPLFDETFEIPINIELREKMEKKKSSVVIFSVMDHRVGFSNRFIAECFISFEEIEKSNFTEQKHLKLSRPSLTDGSCIDALKLRGSDKLAKVFLKSLKRKI